MRILRPVVLLPGLMLVLAGLAVLLLIGAGVVLAVTIGVGVGRLCAMPLWTLCGRPR